MFPTNSTKCCIISIFSRLTSSKIKNNSHLVFFCPGRPIILNACRRHPVIRPLNFRSENLRRMLSKFGSVLLETITRFWTDDTQIFARSGRVKSCWLINKSNWFSIRFSDGVEWNIIWMIKLSVLSSSAVTEPLVISENIWISPFTRHRLARRNMFSGHTITSPLPFVLIVVFRMVVYLLLWLS